MLWITIALFRAFLSRGNMSSFALIGIGDNFTFTMVVNAITSIPENFQLNPKRANGSKSPAQLQLSTASPRSRTSPFPPSGREPFQWQNISSYQNLPATPVNGLKLSAKSVLRIPVLD